MNCNDEWMCHLTGAAAAPAVTSGSAHMSEHEISLLEQLLRSCGCAILTDHLLSNRRVDACNKCACYYAALVALQTPSVLINTRRAASSQDVSAGDNEARTPLHYAAGYNHAEIAVMLLEAGANLEARDSKVRRCRGCPHCRTMLVYTCATFRVAKQLGCFHPIPPHVQQ